jgi:uncharacterized protein involved in cysteine biosynthesis
VTALPAKGPLRAPGFFDGVASLPRAVAELARSPALWPRALVPTLGFALLFTGAVALSWFVARPWLLEHLPEARSGLGRWGAGAAGIGFAAVLSLGGWFAALALAPPLSAPALETLVTEIEARLGAPPRAPLGFFAELACGFRALFGAALVALPTLFVLWLVQALVPPAAAVTVPVAALVSALLVAWGLFDYPLTLRGVGFRERLRFVRRNFACVLGFGGAFALAFWLPCCGVVLLPVGAIAATRLVAGILGWGAR